MPVQFNNKIQVGRIDSYSVNPQDVIADENLRGRFIPPTEDDIKALAESISEKGQIQPITVRKVERDSQHGLLQVVCGYTRLDSMKLIQKGFSFNGKTFPPKPDIKVKANLEFGNDEKAFLVNLDENAKRAEVSDMDHAHNQEKLRKDFKKSDAEISKIYGWAQPEVCRIKKLLELPSGIQRLVHIGKKAGGLATETAIQLLSLTGKDFEDAVSKILAGEKVTAREIKEIVREQQKASIPTPANPTNSDSPVSIPVSNPEVSVSSESPTTLSETSKESDKVVGFVRDGVGKLIPVTKEEAAEKAKAVVPIPAPTPPVLSTIRKPLPSLSVVKGKIPSKSKSLARTLSDVKDFLLQVSEKGTPNAKAVSKSLLLFIQGTSGYAETLEVFKKI